MFFVDEKVVETTNWGDIFAVVLNEPTDVPLSFSGIEVKMNPTRDLFKVRNLLNQRTLK